jgi:hypothetical protein
MRRFGIGVRVVSVLVPLLLVQEAAGGRLRDLEKKVAEKSAEKSEKKKEPKPVQTYDTAATSSFGSGTYPSGGGDDSFLGGLMAWLITAPLQYRHDDPAAMALSHDEAAQEGWAETSTGWFPRHEPGQATVPYARIDYNRQYVDDEVNADDVRIEAGYKLLAFHGRTTMYTDDSDGYTLDFNQYYAVLRYGGFRPDFLPGTFEAGFGVGVSQIKGDEEDSSGALTIPLKYYPFEWCGLEFRPAWYRWMDLSVGDYDISASVGYRFLQLRGGYRWMWVQGIGHENDGPYAGISLSF